MRLYVYCLGTERAARAAEGMGGVGDSSVTVVALGRVAAVVSEFGADAAAVSRENVRAHNRVNARVLAAETPLPFRFGTLASESRLNEYVKSNEDALVSALARVGGCVEMGVKIRWNAEEVSGEQEALSSKEGVGGGARAGSGTAFLLAKRREIMGGDALRARAEEVSAWLAGRVAGLVRESDVRVNASGALVVRAAHLVERARLDEYRERVRDAALERPHAHFLTSGPWPPYGFTALGR